MSVFCFVLIARFNVSMRRSCFFVIAFSVFVIFLSLCWFVCVSCVVLFVFVEMVFLMLCRCVLNVLSVLLMVC